MKDTLEYTIGFNVGFTGGLEEKGKATPDDVLEDMAVAEAMLAREHWDTGGVPAEAVERYWSGRRDGCEAAIAFPDLWLFKRRN